MLNAERGFIEGDIQRDRGASLTFSQGVLLNHFIGQHGYFVAGHVHRGQAIAAQLIDGAVGLNGQTRRCNVNAHDHGA